MLIDYESKYAELLIDYNKKVYDLSIMRQTYIDAVREIRHDLENMEKVIRNRLT